MQNDDAWKFARCHIPLFATGLTDCASCTTPRRLVAAAVSDDASCRYHLVSRVGWCNISHSCATYYCHASSLIKGATRLPHTSEPYHADLSRRGDNQLRQIGNTALLREDAFESGRASKCAREVLIRMATNQFLDSFGPTQS